MNDRILYAGDTSLTTAACYMAGILHDASLPYDYLAGDQPIAPALAGAEHALYIISDYPVNQWAEEDFPRVLSAVRDGAGLLMLGGWESFHGAAGEYQGSPLSEALPIEMADHDDRVNCPQPCLIECVAEHPITASLPWDRPPTIGGYNRFATKADAEVLLNARSFLAAMRQGEARFEPAGCDPLLVVGRFGRGRTAALATDVAPHWVGGFVDWGPQRLAARAPDADAIEVGSDYAQFFRQLVLWAMGKI